MSSCSNIGSVDDLKSNKGITLFHWNCRSMWNKFEEIVYMVTHSDSEYCFFSETWLSPVITDDMISIPGYNLYRIDRDSRSKKARGGGLIAYIKDDLKAVYLPDQSIISPSFRRFLPSQEYGVVFPAFCVIIIS